MELAIAAEGVSSSGNETTAAVAVAGGVWLLQMPADETTTGAATTGEARSCVAGEEARE
jgi:hypothetical protein